MLHKLISHLFEHRVQFFKYFLVGFSGLFLDMGTLVLFKEWLGLGAVLGVVLNQLVVMPYNFFLNKYWSFKNKSFPHKQLVRYLSLMGGNYLFSVGAMQLVHDVWGGDYRLVRLGTIMVMVTWNFLLYKHWVYRD